MIDANGTALPGYHPVPRTKINVGVPFYGMGNAGGIREWNRTYRYSFYYQDENFDPHLNYANESYYNGPTTIRDKTAYALLHGKVGGIMIWALTHDVTYDARYSLLKTIRTTIDMFSYLKSTTLP